MLIRSQDRNTLTQFYVINIIPHIKTQYDCDIESPEPIKDEKWIMYAVQSEHAHEMIGEYSTEAKAIKVMDMIQEQLEENEKTYREGISYLKAVFQMPADEEVEV